MACHCGGSCGCGGGGRRGQFRFSWPSAGGHARGDAPAPDTRGGRLTQAVQIRQPNRGRGADVARTANLRVSSYNAPKHPAAPYGRLKFTEQSSRLQLVDAPALSADLAPTGARIYPPRRNYPALQGPQYRYTKVTERQVQDQAAARIAARRRVATR